MAIKEKRNRCIVIALVNVMMWLELNVVDATVWTSTSGDKVSDLENALFNKPDLKIKEECLNWCL